jgi:hypothetical protein
MPSVTPDDWSGLSRIPRPSAEVPTERAVVSVTTAPSAFDGAGFPGDGPSPG